MAGAGAAQARGGRGLGRRRHGDRADHRRPPVKAVTIDPDAIDPEDPELLQDMVTAATNEAIRCAQELAAVEARRPGRRPRRARPARACTPARSLYVTPLPSSASSPSSASCPGIGPRTAQRLAFHILRTDPEDADAAGRRDPRGQGEDRLLRGLLQPRRGAALRDLPRRAPRRVADLRRRGARRRDPGRAHARVPRPLPRARRRAVADRRRRPRGPQASPSSTRASPPPTRRSARSCWPRTRRRPARRPRCTSPRALHERAPDVAVTRLASGPAGRLGPRVRRRGHARARACWAGASCWTPTTSLGRPMSLGTIVMKFGGTSVADAERLKRAAARIVAKREEGYRVVAVLSARGKETDRLIADAFEVSPEPRPARDGHAALDRRARLVRAVRDGDQRPRPPRDLADRLAGRDRHRHLAHQGADPRRARRPHHRGARRGPASCSSPASRASRPPRT